MRSSETVRETRARRVKQSWEARRRTSRRDVNTVSPGSVAILISLASGSADWCG